VLALRGVWRQETAAGHARRQRDFQEASGRHQALSPAETQTTPGLNTYRRGALLIGGRACAQVSLDRCRSFPYTSPPKRKFFSV